LVSKVCDWDVNWDESWAIFALLLKTKNYESYLYLQESCIICTLSFLKKK
jgi:hypothetical protein